jgi:hypothetical protein
MGQDAVAAACDAAGKATAEHLRILARQLRSNYDGLCQALGVEPPSAKVRPSFLFFRIFDFYWFFY